MGENKKSELEKVNDLLSQAVQTIIELNKNYVREEDYQQLLKDYSTLQNEKEDCEKEITSLEGFKNSIKKIFDTDDVAEVTQKYVTISGSLDNTKKDKSQPTLSQINKEELI